MQQRDDQLRLWKRHAHQTQRMHAEQLIYCVHALLLTHITISTVMAECVQMLVDEHGGQVPRTFDELELLPGVGHKTASVVMAVAFKSAQLLRVAHGPCNYCS